MSHEVPRDGQVLGVDVGWAETKKTTGACVLTWDAGVITLTLHRVTAVGLDVHGVLAPDKTLLALAVDGPVRGHLDLIAKYRTAESILTRRFASRIGKPGQSSSGNGKKLNAAANVIARTVISTGRLAQAEHAARIQELAVVEAFPTTFLGVMLDEGRVPPHGARSDAYYRHLLGPSGGTPPPPLTDRLTALIEELLPGRRLATDMLASVSDRHASGLAAYGLDHEDRAAVICALTALCVVCRRYVAVGDADDGYIILPPRADAGAPGLQPWAWKILDANAAATAGARVIVE